MTLEPRWLTIARAEIGVKETAGDADTPRIVEYHDTTTLHAQDDETPWCSAFANWVLKEAGLVGSGKANARSWLHWGKTILQPRTGAICILWRGKQNSPQGHVGFVVKADDTHIWLLGGNQGDAVSIARFPMQRVLGYRWPTSET